MVRRGNKAYTKVLIEWVGFSEDKTTWEFLMIDPKRKYSDVDLVDKVVALGRM